MSENQELVKQNVVDLEQERVRLISQDIKKKIFQYLLYVCIAGGFIIFWVQVGYTSQNKQYKDDEVDFIQKYKNFDVIGGSFREVYSDDGQAKSLRYGRESIATFTIYTSLNQVLPTTLDMFVLLLFTSFNLLVIQSGVGLIQTILNGIFLVKDILVIASFIWYEDQTGWTFKNGFSNWGYMFLRNPFFFDLLIAMLNIFVLRWSYFKIAFMKKYLLSDYWYCRLADPKILADSSLQWHPFRGNNIVFQNTGLTTFLVYFGLIFSILLPHFFTGLIFFVLGIFTFFTPTVFYFGLDKILFKRLKTTFQQAKQLEQSVFANINSETPQSIQDKLEKLSGDPKSDLSIFKTNDETTLKNFYQKVKTVLLFNQVLLYLKYILIVYLVFQTIAYGTIYAQGVHIVGLLRYMYNSPIQFTLNVLSRGITKSPRLMQAARVLASL